jgi:tetratricopeptide (TPR) repeat protein
VALLRRADVDLGTASWHSVLRLSIDARFWGEYEVARTLLERALALNQLANNRGSAASVRAYLALIEREQGRYERARTLLEESLAGYQELGDPGGMAHALVGLGDVARDQGDAEQAIAFSTGSLT